MPLYPLMFCNDIALPLYQSRTGLINVSAESLMIVCDQIKSIDLDSETEGKYNKPMVYIGIYISIATLFCILAMVLDLLYGFRNRKFWFPCKYFPLNAASITVITVAMKLPVDLSSPMPGVVDQVAKFGSLAFMCTMMSNLMPSLGSMDNKSLVANVTGLSILVITMIVNIFIQIKTQVIMPETLYHLPLSMVTIAYIYTGMLLVLLIVLISSAITIPTTKKILEFKYQGASKTTLDDQNPPQNLVSTLEKLRQLVKRYWIMAETGNPQFMMASNPLSSASGIICAISMAMYIYLVCQVVLWDHFLTYSVYKWSTLAIVSTQSVGVVVGAIAPIFRCFTVLSFKSFAKQNRNHFLVSKVEKYWIQKLSEWQESRISFLSSGHRSRVLLHNLKNLILSFCIGFQKVIVVSSKIIGLLPIVVLIFVVYCSYYLKSLKAMFFTSPTTSFFTSPTTSFFTSSTTSSSNDTNEDLSSYCLLLKDDMWVAERIMKRTTDSMNRLIQKAEKKQYSNLLRFLENSVSFDGVQTFDTDQIQSLLSVEPVKSWSLPVVSLTCIAIVLPNIHKDVVDNMFKSVGEGLLYTHLMEKTLYKAFEYVNIRRATVTLWHEVEENNKWLETTLKRSTYKGKKPREILESFAHTAKEIVNEFNTSTDKKTVEKQNLPLKVIAANSMYRIIQMIIHTYENNNLEIVEYELFTRLSHMIADILAACLTNIPQVVAMRCHENTIEKREASVLAAINLLGQTTKIIKKLETRELPKMDPNKMGFIDEWRLYLNQP